MVPNLQALRQMTGAYKRRRQYFGPRLTLEFVAWSTYNNFSSQCGHHAKFDHCSLCRDLVLSYVRYPEFFAPEDHKKGG